MLQFQGDCHHREKSLTLPYENQSNRGKSGGKHWKDIGKRQEGAAGMAEKLVGVACAVIRLDQFSQRPSRNKTFIT